MQPSTIQRLHGSLKTFIKFVTTSDHLVFRYTTLIENDVANMGALLAHLFIGPAKRKAWS